MLDWLNDHWGLIAANPAAYLTLGVLCFGIGFALCRLLDQSRIETLSERLLLREDERDALTTRLSEITNSPNADYTQFVRLSAEQRVLYLESKAAEKLLESVAEHLLKSTLKRAEGVNIDWRLVRKADWLSTSSGETKTYGPNKEFVLCRIIRSIDKLGKAIFFPAQMQEGPLLLCISPPGKGVVTKLDGNNFRFEPFDGVNHTDIIEIRSIGLFSFPAVEFEKIAHK
jgi:hypothetical protein